MPGTIGQVNLGTTVSGGWTGYTAIIRVDENGNPGGATITGILNQVRVRVGGTGTVKLKIFRDDGTNYVYVWGDTVARDVVAGVNAFDVNVEVQSGDFLGVYFAVYNINRAADTGPADAAVYRFTDVVADSLKSDWTNYAGRLSGGGDILIPVTLVVADLGQGDGLDGISLAQDHILAINNLLDGNTLDSVALTQNYILGINNLGHTINMGTPTLSQLSEYTNFKFGYINNPYWTDEPENPKRHAPCGYFYKRRSV